MKGIRALSQLSKTFFMTVSISSLLVLPLVSYSAAAAPVSNNQHPSTYQTPIRSVVVVGGTHGNEYTGVWCIKELERPTVHQRVSKRYPSLDISTLMGNPEAHLANRRFIDTDLNREFTTEKLKQKAQLPPDTLSLEAKRAQEINKLLGPKNDPKTDVVVDLHTTTTNMGITLIIPEHDAVMAQAAAYVLRKCQENPIRSKTNAGPIEITEDARIVMHSIPNRDNRPNLSSVGKHGFTIEVGPVPQGVIRQDAVEKSKLALESFFEFLERHNQSEKRGQSMVDLIRKWYPRGRIPCYRSATARKEGEMSGKIRWPCSDHNPNFPAYMIHHSIQDQDFCLLKTGDPLFVTLDGTVIPYDGSHGDPVHLMFVNEGGYYYASSGTGIGTAVATEYNLETADFVNVEDLTLISNNDDTEDMSLE